VRERAAQRFNKNSWVRGQAETPHPSELVERPALPSPARGRGHNNMRPYSWLSSARSILFASRPACLPNEIGLHCGPLAPDDAVDIGVAQRAVRGDLMVAQDAIEFRSQAFDRSSALMIEGVSPEFDGDAVERLECVREQHQLALGIQRRALDAPAVPR